MFGYGHIVISQLWPRFGRNW